MFSVPAKRRMADLPGSLSASWRSVSVCVFVCTHCITELLAIDGRFDLFLVNGSEIDDLSAAGTIPQKTGP